MHIEQRLHSRKWKWLANLMILLGAGLFLFALLSYLHGYWLQYLLSKEWEARQAEELKELKGKATSRPSALSYNLPKGEIVAKLEIPKIGLDTIIVEGIDNSTLKKGPGHYPGTVLPGQRGNCIIASHRDTFFRNVGELDINDPIKVSMAGYNYTYVVTNKQVVKPTDLTPMNPTSYPALTLITCYPFHYIGPAPKRYIVTAQLSN